MTPLRVAFVGAGAGAWSVERLEAVAGEPLPPAYGPATAGLSR